jgi:hypothetical protein
VPPPPPAGPPGGIATPERPHDRPPPAAAGEPPRPLHKLGQAVVGLLAFVIVADLLALWADLLQLSLLTDVRDGRRASLEELTASDDRVMAVGLLQLGAYVACVVAFLIWYGRAFRNLERLGARDLHWGRRAVIVYWFIPIVNLFLPKQVMNDIWRASDPDEPAVSHHWESNRVPVLFHLWWAMWIVSSVVTNILLRNSLDQGETPDELVSIGTQFVVIDVVDIIPAILAILVVRATTSRQEERRARYERGQLGPEGPASGELPAAAPASLPG